MLVLCLLTQPMYGLQQMRKASEAISPPPAPNEVQNQQLSLKQLLTIAEKQYPLIRAKRSLAEAKLNAITATERTIIPTLDLSLQANAASYNNITGMFFPQGILPISGPPSAGNSFVPAWGSAASALFTWQPITFGQREADVALAQAEWAEASADAEQERLQHTAMLLENYLDLTLSHELRAVAEANLVRATALAARARILTENGLQPSADSALAAAERSRAAIDLLTTQELETRLRARLMELVGLNEPPNIVPDSLLLRTVPQVNTGALALDTAQNPALQMSAARVQASKARKDAVSASTNPRLTFWTTAYTRGSGVTANGTLLEGVGGLEPNRFNYGVGLHLSWSPLSYLQVAPKLHREEAIMRASQDQFEQTRHALQGQIIRADARLQTALRIAEEIPKQTQAAEIAFTNRQTKYNAELLPYSDIAQARYLLAQAEAEARVRIAEVWKALVSAAAVRGDFHEVLQQLHGQ